MPRLLIGAAVVVPVVLAACLSWAGYRFYSGHAAANTRAAHLSRVAERIVHLDEVLTMSARMAAATGDTSWIDRYRQFEPELDRLIQEAKSLVPIGEGLQNVSTTDEANAALVRMEHRSFELVLQGRQAEAWALLTGPEYERQKTIYADGIKALVDELETRRQEEATNQRLRLHAVLIGFGLIVALVLTLWYGVLRIAVTSWRRKADQIRVMAEELQLSEERLRVTLGSIGDGLIAVDTQHRVTQMNRVSEQLTGWALEEALGRPVQDVLKLVNEQTRCPAANPIDKVLQTGEVHGLADHTLLVARDGTEHAIADSAAPIRGEVGKIHGVVLVFRDVTEQRQRERALKESEKRFHDVLYASRDAILLIDGETFVDCNQATAEMLGYSTRDAFLMTHPSVLSPPTQPGGRDSFEKANEMIRTAFKKGSHRFEWTHRRANGQDFPVEVSLTPISYKGKTVLHCLWRDITERKRMEEEIVSERANLKAIFEASPVGLLLLDENTAIRAVNEVAERLVNKTATEMINAQPGEALGCIHISQDAAECGQGPHCPSCPIRAGLEGTLRSGQPLRKLAVQPVLLSGGKRVRPWLEISAEPLTIDGRRHVIAAVSNITDRKHAEEQLVHLATHDPLTGLPNRRLLEDALKRATARSRRGVPSALVLFDVDHFKAVNDGLGHAVGDDVLVRVAELVRKELRTEDILARLGGDEFGLLLEGAATEQALAIAERARAAVEACPFTSDRRIQVSLSIGVVQMACQEDVEQLYYQADAAMYQAKDQGRNRVVLYQDTTSVSAGT